MFRFDTNIKHLKPILFDELVYRFIIMCMLNYYDVFSYLVILNKLYEYKFLSDKNCLVLIKKSLKCII